MADKKRTRCPGRTEHSDVSAQLGPLTKVPLEAAPSSRSRRKAVVPERPPEDVVGLLQERAGLPAEEALQLWRRATTFTPQDEVADPYNRWWTHRCAALNLGRLLQRHIAVDLLPLAEISGYAALLWPLVLAILRQVHPLANYLQGRPEEPSHLTWTLETAYVPVCIAVYAADNGRWLVVLNAAVEEPADPWRTVDSAVATTLGNIPAVVQRLYIAAVDEVDVPVYAPRESQPKRCPQCHWWCGWDGTCRHCQPAPRPQQYDLGWQSLEQGSRLEGVPPEHDLDVALLGHSTTHAALLALKARCGIVTLRDAMDLVRSLRPAPSLSGILYQAGYGFQDAQAILQRVQAGTTLQLALRGPTHGRW